MIFPRTVTLGAMVCLADMIEVFLLNMTYDVPVKLFSFHLILMSLLLLAPQVQRLANFFFLNRPAEPLAFTQLFASRRANRIAVSVLSLVWLWMLGANVYGSWKGWHEYGGGRPKPALYGIWDIEQFTQDGQVRPPLLTDTGRYSRAIFDFADSVVFLAPDDTRTGYDYRTDTHTGALAMTKSTDKNLKANFTVVRTAPDQITLDRSIDGHKTTLQLHHVDHMKFLSASRGFHWISEYPFNR